MEPFPINLQLNGQQLVIHQGEILFDDFFDASTKLALVQNAMCGVEENYHLINEVEQITEVGSASLDAYLFQSKFYFNEMEYETAMALTKPVIDCVMQSMPNDVQGAKLSWDDVDNQSFLRLYYYYLNHALHAEAYEEFDKYWSMYEAVEDPTDDLQMRCLAAQYYLVLGQFEKTLNLLDVNYHPVEYYYFRTYIYFQQADYLAACHAFRIGMLVNPYVAESILGNQLLMARPYTHFNVEETVFYATNLMTKVVQNLFDDTRLLLFMNWVKHQPIILAEQMRFILLRSNYDAGKTPEDRAETYHKIQSFAQNASPNDMLAIKLNNQNSQGETIHAWLTFT